MAGKAWSPAEDQIVRQIHASDKQVADCCHLLPVRTANAIQSRMKDLQLGRRKVARQPWSDEEDAVVREIWPTEGSIKSLMRMLPNRSWRSIVCRGADLGLGPRDPELRVSTYSWVEEEVSRVLGEFANLTAQKIASRSPASLKRINQILAEGRGSKYYISGWWQPRVTNGGALAARWSLGAEKDVPKPERKSHAEHSRNYRARQRAAHGPAMPFSTIIQQVTA
jgi:hypothetical protein